MTAPYAPGRRAVLRDEHGAGTGRTRHPSGRIVRGRTHDHRAEDVQMSIQRGTPAPAAAAAPESAARRRGALRWVRVLAGPTLVTVLLIGGVGYSMLDKATPGEAGRCRSRPETVAALRAEAVFTQHPTRGALDMGRGWDAAARGPGRLGHTPPSATTGCRSPSASSSLMMCTTPSSTPIRQSKKSTTRSSPKPGGLSERMKHDHAGKSSSTCHPTSQSR